MRKQTKLVAVLSAAALLAIGASMTSFAKGWTEENGEWVYLDSDGERVYGEWKKSGNNYYYLDDETGAMATSKLIEYTDGNTYYVDENGVKVHDRWIGLENEDDIEINNENVDTLWYYFGSTGKAVKDDDKKVNGKKYFFDSEGHMISGWYTAGDGKTYYLGESEDGAATVGWAYLEPEDSESDAYDDEEWFYFTSSGEMTKNKRKYINGKYYAFDENGVMADKWIVGTPASAAGAYYTADNGAQVTGWYYTYEKGADGKINEDGDQYWFYLDKYGKPFNEGNTDTTATASKKDGSAWKAEKTGVKAKVIKSKTYVFDNKGQMLTGVQRLTNVSRDGSTEGLDGVYYFSKASGATEGQMTTGKQTVTYDGDSYYYYFQKDGKAYENTVKDGVLYGRNGERVNAEDGNTYECITLGDRVDATEADGTIKVVGKSTTIDVTKEVIVSSSGKIKQSGTVTIEGTKYYVDNYIVVDKVAK